MNALLITGTDTGVGKTIVTASLARALHARDILPGIRKPFASGVTAESTFHDDDALLLKTAASSADRLDQIRPATYQAALAPLSAARLESRLLDPQELLASIRDCISNHFVTLVEGVGGAAVPVADGMLFSDFARQLDIPVLVVARSTLGTVNHTLLTVDHLRSKGIVIAGVVFVRHSSAPLDMAEQTSPDLITEFTPIQNFGIVPYAAQLAAATTVEQAVHALPHQSPPIQAITDWLLKPRK